MPESDTVTPFTPRIDMRIRYVQARPMSYSPLIETGRITLIDEKRGLFFVMPDRVTALPKWRTANDVLEVIENGTAESAAVKAAISAIL
jgi:hypothetical protein